MHSFSCPSTEGLNRLFSLLFEGTLIPDERDTALPVTRSLWVAALSSTRGMKDKESGVQRQLANSN